MRWIFFSLVVVNLVYFGWQWVVGVAEWAPPKAVMQAAPAVPELRLLAEDPQPPRVAKPLHDRPGPCVVVGPWDHRNTANQAGARLEDAGLSVRVRQITVQDDPLHWVYLPPFSSHDQAMEVLKELQSRDVSSFIVTTGEYANAISLGYFRNGDSAQGIRMKMRQEGYSAYVTQIIKPVTEFWLSLSRAAASSPALLRFMARHSGVGQRQVACRR